MLGRLTPTRPLDASPTWNCKSAAESEVNAAVTAVPMSGKDIYRVTHRNANGAIPVDADGNEYLYELNPKATSTALPSQQ